MHPVIFLFEDIYRNYWGIPDGQRRRAVKRRAELPLDYRARRNGKRG